MLAMGTRKIRESDFGLYSRNEAFTLLSTQAESLADKAALWRKKDPRSINTMIMMWQLLSDGDLTSRGGRQYLKAAIASLEELAPGASPVVDRATGGYDCYLALVVGHCRPPNVEIKGFLLAHRFCERNRKC
jgi:hypothetical protein